MSKDSKLSSSIRSPLDDSDNADGDGVQLHGVLKLKNVLYYKKHSMKAVPAKGTIKLSQKTLSFQSKGYDFVWDLDSIRVEKFKGRVNGGMKVYAQIKNGAGEDVEEEYTFTMVKQRSYDMICISIDEAKFDSEMLRVRNTSRETIFGADGDNLKRTLSVVDEPVKTKRHLLPQPLRFIVLGIFQLLSFVYKIFTGRRLRFGGPKNMHHALHSVLRKVNPIITVAEITQSKRTVMAIKKDIGTIHESLMTMKRVAQRQKSEFLSSGAVADSRMESGSLLERSGISTAKVHAIQYLSYLVFSIRKLLNLPVYRWGLEELYEQPSTVSQAVKETNDELESLMELVVTDKFPSEAVSAILGEAKKIQILLYNIKVHCGEVKQSSTKEE